MPENLYVEDPGGGHGGLGLIGSLAIWEAHSAIQGAGLLKGTGLNLLPDPSTVLMSRAAGAPPMTPWAHKIAVGATEREWKKMGHIGRWRRRRKAANRISSGAWEAFFSGGQGGGFKGAQKYLQSVPGLSGIGRLGTFGALAKPFMGAYVAYEAVGSLLPAAAEGLVAGFNELARFGRKLRSGAPETSSTLRSMATRERAFTMRQASLMAIHTSQLGVRAALGSEAEYLHM
jgi:hypothetical protein